MKKYSTCTKSILTIMLAVTLTGCQTTSRGIPGIAGFVHNTPTTNSLASSVQAAFDNEPTLSGMPIKIEAQGDMVRLSGYVKTIRQSDMAAFVASKVNGVKTLDNNLIVRK